MSRTISIEEHKDRITAVVENSWGHEVFRLRFDNDCAVIEKQYADYSWEELESIHPDDARAQFFSEYVDLL